MRILSCSAPLSLSLASNESTLEDSATFVRRRRRRDTSQILIALCLTFDTRRVATDFSLTFLLFVSTLRDSRVLLERGEYFDEKMLVRFYFGSYLFFFFFKRNIFTSIFFHVDLI